MKNFHGIYFKGDSSSNIIKENTIIHNHNGIYIPGFISYSSNNYIFNNNFIHNSIQAYDDCENIWDSGYPTGGNFWSSYAGRDRFGGLNQNEDWSDGIGDTPYLIFGANNRWDRYPFMNPDGWNFVLDQHQSFFTLTNEHMCGLTTCPAGDGPAYAYAKATIRNVQGKPLIGIPASSFRWRATAADTTQYYGDLSCRFNPVDNETNAEGEIRFEIIGNTSIVGEIMIDFHVLGVIIYGVHFLDCVSFDLNVDGAVNLTDFSVFSNEYGGTDWHCDFNWDGIVSLPDFALFAAHYGHPP